MKIAPLYHALKKEAWVKPVIVHTGQHYDLNMSDVFFSDLKLPSPDIHLGVGSGTHAEQTGNVLIAYEKVILERQPDLIIVVGDVNSTLACTLAAIKVKYPKTYNPNRKMFGQKNVLSRLPASPVATGNEVLKGKTNPSGSKLPRLYAYVDRPFIAHLEAGLRSFDRTMPEEINRIATDALADILWTPSRDADDNLRSEGIVKDKIECVGNIMIDSLEMMRTIIEKQQVFTEFGLPKGGYGVVTFHRPANVDDPELLSKLCSSLVTISKRIPIIFPIHPRTRKNLKESGLLEMLKRADSISVSEPLNYVRFMNLIFNCRFVITDSGGIQEETTYLGIPCLTMRPNTERPITVMSGTNRLCTILDIREKVEQVLSGSLGDHKVPEFWDGQTSHRITASIKKRWNG